MASHTFWVDECPCNLHADDGWRLVALYQLICGSYLDGIMIFNRSWEEHIHHIRQVLQTLWQHKLCTNLKKCTFGMTQVQYMGYIIDDMGVHVDPTKI